MSTTLHSGRQRSITRASILLVMVALIMGILGCSLPPVRIQDWYDLNAMRYIPNGRYRLANDLGAASPGYWEVASIIANEGRGWRPIGTTGNPFAGTFDAQGYEIRDLFVDRPAEDEVGLFGCVAEGAIIENVEVVNTAVTGRRYVGGVVGNNSGTLSNSCFIGSITGEQYLGALVGWNIGTVSNSYYDFDQVPINGENVITIGALFAEDFERWLANGKFSDVNESLSQENGYYLLNNVSDFKELLAFGQDRSLRFRLTNNLNLGSEPNFYIPYLAGELDGSGHRILGFRLSSDSVSQIGLFGYLAPGGKITDLSVENVNVSGAYVVGGLVGGNNGIVSNLYCSGSVAGDDRVGGMIGYNWNGSVSNSYSAGNVVGKRDVGGLIGINGGALTNCYSTSAITGWYSTGGLAGTNRGSVANSYSSGTVSAWYSVGSLIGTNEGSLSNSYSSGAVTGWYSVGGLIGVNSQSVSNAHSDASVSGRSDVGGLVGSNRGPVRDSYVTGSVAGERDVGGLVGTNHDAVRNSYATGSVSGQWNAGGLIGTNHGSLKGSYCTGSMTGDYYLGGLVGANNGTVINSLSRGSVIGNYYVGGLTGSNSGNVSTSYSTSSVSGSSIVSGLVGINDWDGTVSNSYSTGSVAGNYYIAGLVGVNFGRVNNSYSRGNVTGQVYVGGLLAVNFGGTASNSFWDTQTSGQATSASGTGRTTAQMQDVITFLGVGWDISAVGPGVINSAYTWNIVDRQTYPFLTWQSAI